MNSIELLSPAGDFERFLSAVNFGCDAVYLAGENFGMRKGPDNFSREELKRATEIAHKNNVKVYLTCNTLARNDELDELRIFVADVAEFGIDAFIVADLGVFHIIKSIAPNVDIHISTQAGVVNYETANMFWNMGAKRVVLARELSLDEIATIRAKTNKSLEIEAFVHGAMCMSFSGRCLISNYLTNRDANRGECCQPCRWKYYINEETRPGEFFPIEEYREGTYLFNSKDMCMIEHIPELISAGVTSLKIEGRAKSAYYVAVVTNAYRCAINEYLRSKKEGKSEYKLSDWIKEETNKISHREYSTGFYFGNEPGQVTDNGGYVRSYDVVAIVDECKDGLIRLSQRNRFSVGDIIDVLPIGSKPREIVVSKLFDEYMTPITVANKAAHTVYVECEDFFPANSIFRKKRNV